MSSTEHNTTSVPVLIVGGGPAGLVTAITLARYGVDCLLVDSRDELSDQPRATAISVRSMELLRSWGLESRVLEGALDVSFRGRIGETLTGPGSLIPLGYPTPEEAARVSPVAPVCAPQDHLEPVFCAISRACARHACASAPSSSTWRLGPAAFSLGSATCQAGASRRSPPATSSAPMACAAAFARRSE